MKTTKELRELSIDEINVRLNESKKELLKLNVQVASGSGLSNPREAHKVKKNIARMLTLLKEKEVKRS